MKWAWRAGAGALLAVAAVVSAPATRGEETVRLPAGAVLREVASPLGLVVTVVGEAGEATVLDRSGEWVRVALGETVGWVDPEARQAARESEVPSIHGGGAAPTESDTAPAVAPPSDPAPSGREPGTSARRTSAAPHLLPDAGSQRLADARLLLGAEVVEAGWGRFALVTDAAAHPFLPLGERLAAELPGLYARRYGLVLVDPSPAAPAPLLGSVVLFARDKEYRTFLALTTGQPNAPLLAGHAAGGVAALALGDRTPRQAGALLLHELAHLLNHARVGPALPAWLDEGIAGDMELVEIEATGGLDEGAWASGATGYRGRPGRSGALVVLDRLVAETRRGRLETLAELAALDRATLLASPRRSELYALSALWIRFLLDDPGRAAAFRQTLAALAALPAPPPDGGVELLARSLGADAGALERSFPVWLADLARRFDVADPRPRSRRHP